MTELTIGPARADDAPVVAALHLLSWQQAYGGLLPAEPLAQRSLSTLAVQWRQAILSGTVSLALAREGAGAAGFVSFGRCRDADADDTCGEIWALYVMPSHWSRGVGRALWLHACEQLRTAGFVQVSLWVLADNERALRFYRRAGLRADPGVMQTIERGGRQLLEVRYRARL
jgi:ribosomal protein S18 acetylase RimI-like enzyme